MVYIMFSQDINGMIRMIFNKRHPNVFTRIILRVKIRDHMLIGLKDIWRILTIPTSEEWKDFEKKEEKEE